MALDDLARAGRAERIKQLREESPYTQPVLADRVGVTLRAYQRWEEGGGIEWEHLEKLAEIHDVDVQWLHRGQERGATPDPFASASAEAVAELRAELAALRTELLAEIAKVRKAQEALRKTQQPAKRNAAKKRS